MNQHAHIMLSIIAGVILAISSNWLYDILRERGVLPARPSIKRIAVIFLGFVPFAFLVALPQIRNQHDPRSDINNDYFLIGFWANMAYVTDVLDDLRSDPENESLQIKELKRQMAALVSEKARHMNLGIEISPEMLNNPSIDALKSREEINKLIDTKIQALNAPKEPRTAFYFGKWLAEVVLSISVSQNADAAVVRSQLNPKIIFFENESKHLKTLFQSEEVKFQLTRIYDELVYLARTGKVEATDLKRVLDMCKQLSDLVQGMS